jgi:hypothetical protein
MTSFYQPKSTQGIYDAAASRLTVNCGDSVLIGFRAAPKKLSDIQVDADIGAILGRYAAGPNAIELRIDTVMYLTNPDFEFRGAYVKRRLAYYQNPISSGVLFVGYPAEYQTRMPA